MVAFLVSSVASSQDDPVPGLNPLWEVGLGGGALMAPDYPGSDHMNSWLIPFPFGVYRGEILHSDRRGGARARIIRGATYEFNVSAGGGLPSSSRGNARRGMSDLEWVGQIGPRLMFDLWSESDLGGRALRLGIPARGVFSTNVLHLKDRGWIFAPELMYDNPRVFGSAWDAYVHITAEFVDRRFADYFYGVAPQFATASRPEYRARAGYLETDLSLGLMIPFRESRLRLYTFASAQSLSGSANRHSPLMLSEFHTSLTVVLLWMFAQSDARVSSND